MWRYVVNTPKYQQGVSVTRCLPRVKGRSCRYGGSKGRFPHATECKQLYSAHNMLAVDEDGESVFLDTFRVSSACVCGITDLGAFNGDSDYYSY